MNPHDKLDRVACWFAHRSLRNEQALIDEPRRARTLMLRDLALFLFMLIVVIVDDHLDDFGVIDVIALLIVGSYVGFTAFHNTRRMHAYRNGWLDGRRSGRHSMYEAQQRGMSAEEWIEAELLREALAAGLLRERRPSPPPPPDGSHDDL